MTKEVYKSQHATLYHGDVIETLMLLPEESVDMIFADPPYNLSNGGITCHSGKQGSVNKAEWDKSKGYEIDSKFHFDWIEACKRVLKPNGTLWISGTYHSIYACGHALQIQGWHIINDVIWFKPNAAPNLACRQFAASHENLIWAKKNNNAKHTFNYSVMKHTEFPKDFIKRPNKQMRTVWSIGTVKKSEKIFGNHPTQKPVALLERIIMSASNEGELILDPFCGSSTTGIVALSNKRNYIGIDSNSEYLLDISVKRLNKFEK